MTDNQLVDIHAIPSEFHVVGKGTDAVVLRHPVNRRGEENL